MQATRGPSRVILITGASSGIGRASARALAERGEHLILVARGVERLEATAAECRALGASSATVCPVDVADADGVDALWRRAVSDFGRIDGVVHSAGVAAYGRFTDIEPAVLERVMATNLLGTANVSRAALRHFTDAGGGALVLVGSLLGKIATPYMSPYLTSKWAVHGLARALQLEFRGSPDIAVTLVSPGGVDTPIYRWAASSLGRQGQPPPPVDQPEKVAAAVVNALARPRREVSVGLSNHLVVLGFRVLPGLFDRMVTPLMEQFGLDTPAVSPHPGNAFSPQPDPVDEPYGQHQGSFVRAVRRTLNVTAGLLAAAGRRLSLRRG